MVAPTLRLFVLGSLDRSAPNRTLIIFGEYKALRGLSRLNLSNDDIDQLTASIAALRSYIESGFPTTINRDSLVHVGSRLFDFLIIRRTRDLFLTATGDAVGQGQFLPLEIIAEDYEISGWPWEYLWDSNNERFISQEFHPVSRSIFSMSSRQPLDRQGGPVRILLILGVMPDDIYTSPSEEIRVIKDVFELHLGTTEFILDILPASDYKKIQDAVSGKRVDIVHFFGHAQFDYERKEGFLSIARPKANPFRVYATQFASLLIASDVRLVFLNACKTAVGSATQTPGRSSIAAALLERGIPGVIGTQFSLPEMSSHSLASAIYNKLLKGSTLGEAVRAGRNAMQFADEANFCDWGIPVLYSTDPNQILFRFHIEKPNTIEISTFRDFVKSGQKYISDGDKIVLEKNQNRALESSVVERTKNTQKKWKKNVVLIDIDAKVGFLPDAAKLLNRSQTYYHFEVAYIPIPSGYVRADLDKDLQTYIPRLEALFRPLPKELNADFVCGLTQHNIAGEDGDGTYWNYFRSSISGGSNIFIASTFGLRRYARDAKVPFARAVFGICIAMLVACDHRFNVGYHKKTVGCLFDFCENRDDAVYGLRKKTFDHVSCRNKIHDLDLLAAIDQFFRVDFSGLS